MTQPLNHVVTGEDFVDVDPGWATVQTVFCPVSLDSLSCLSVTLQWCIVAKRFDGSR